MRVFVKKDAIVEAYHHLKKFDQYNGVVFDESVAKILEVEPKYCEHSGVELDDSYAKFQDNTGRTPVTR